MSYCQCCDNRIANKETTYFRNLPEYTYKFCDLCRKEHPFCPNSPALDDPQDKHIDDGKKHKRREGSDTCCCCSLKYSSNDGLHMRYEDSSSSFTWWLCTRCAMKHETSQKKIQATPATLNELREKVKALTTPDCSA